jgi:hypothetical protein
VHVDYEFNDLDETWAVWLRRGVLKHPQGRVDRRPPHRHRTHGSARRCGAPTGRSETLAEAGQLTCDGDASVLDMERECRINGVTGLG